MDMAVRKMELILTAVLLMMAMVHGVEGAVPDATTVAYVGQDAVLRCPLTEVELDTVSYPVWGTQNGTVLAQNGMIHPYYVDRMSFYTDNRSLVIKNIKMSDAGSYKCWAIQEVINTLHTRIRPQPPVISNRQPNGSMTGTEGQSLTLRCTSRGGKPVPTVTWYSGSTQSTVLASSNSGPLEGDGYTVTATFTFSPTSSYDGSIYICQTSYTSPTLDVLDSVNATLHLNLKPSQPSVEQVGGVVAGSSVTVRCTTSGFRPANSIAISWTYNDVIYSQHATPTQTSGTDTYTAISTLQFPVLKADNGRTAKCIVDHSTLGTPLTGTRNIIVHYKPESAAVAGNHVIVANGANTLTLTCSVGDRNPAPTTISWTRTSSSGTVYTVLTQNTLVLTPTRDDDGDKVTCTADNTIGYFTSAQVTLNLKFHPIITVTVSPTGTVTEGTTDVTLQCSAHSKPAATITWYHNGDALQGRQLSTNAHNTYVTTDNITSVNRQDAGEYKCIATNTVSPPTGDTSNTAVVTLMVRFPPQSVIIEGNREIEAEGHNKLQLNCVVGESNPMSTISWSKTGTVNIGNTHPTQDTTGSYGGSTRSQVLELTPTRDDDGDTITCTAGNGVGQSVTHTITLNLKYNAIASFPHGDETVVEGAPSKDITCDANGKPAATFTWYKGTSSTALASGLGTGSDSQWTSTYTIVGVDRSHAGRYRCLADNGVGAADEKTMTLTVNYPPDVTVTATISDLYLDLACSPSGVPSTYLYSSWEQTWPGYGEITRPLLAEAPTLRLSNLTYADSGIYTCRVSNGVAPYGTNDFIRNASTTAVSSKSHPIITSPSSTENEKHKFAVKLNQPTSVNVSYYSTAEPILVSCYLVIDAVRQSPSVGTVTTDPTQVDLPVFNSIVPTMGTRSVVTWTIVQEFGLGFYEVVIKNTVGEASVVMEAVIEGPPARPEYLQVTGRLSTSVGVSWLPGFHGGYPQTFVVQYSTDEVTWTDGAALDTGLSTGRDRHHVTVDSLRPGTNYHLRMYAHSQLGASLHTVILNVTTSGVQDGAGREARTSFAEGAAVGAGSVGAVIVVCAIGIAVLYIKGYRIRHTNNADKYIEQVYVNEEMTGSIQAQSRGGVEETNASVLAKSDDAPGVYEQLPSAAADDTTTYTQLELHESTNKHQEVEEYENMKI